DRQRNFYRQRADRSRRSLATPDQRRTRAQRLFEQYFARHLFGRRFQSRPANARATRGVRRTHPLSPRTLRQGRQGRDPGAAASRNESPALGDGLSRRRFSLFVVSQVLTIAYDITSALRQSNSLPCSSTGNRIRTRAAADCSARTIRAAVAGNVV